MYSSENSGSGKRGKDAVHYSLVFIGCGVRYVIIAGPKRDKVIECGRRRWWCEHLLTLTNSRMVSSLIFLEGVLGRHDDDVSVSFG